MFYRNYIYKRVQKFSLKPKHDLKGQNNTPTFD